MSIGTNSEPQNFAVKDPSIIVQISPNQRKASGKQAKWKIIPGPHNFHFPRPPEPPSKCHHVVDEELEEAKQDQCGPTLLPS